MQQQCAIEWSYMIILKDIFGKNTSLFGHVFSEIMAGQPTPPNVPPPEIAGLMIRAYENPLVSLNKLVE